MRDDVSGLKSLGSGETVYLDKVDPTVLESFPNQFSDRDYVVTHATEELTSLCPRTGQPDFGGIRIEYCPDKLCVESKSLKLYLFSFRNEGSFMETIVNRILGDLVGAILPRWMEVEGEFRARGGIQTTVVARYDEGSG